MMADSDDYDDESKLGHAGGRISFLRSLLNRNTMFATVVAIAVMVGALVVIVQRLNPSVYESRNGYYYDLNTGQLFVAPAELTPPIDAPSGGLVRDGKVTDLPAGVRAFVFSCTDCEDESTRFVGMTEMYSSKAKHMLDHPEAYVDKLSSPELEDEHYLVMDDGHLYGQVLDDGRVRWVKRVSDEGVQIELDIQSRCQNVIAPTMCFPD